MEKKYNRLKQATLLEALITLIVAAFLLSYASYAWLVSSKTVKAEGVKLSLTAPNDLLISLSGNDGTWTEHLEITQSELNILNTSQTAVGMFLLPSSSLTGFDGAFFATSSATVGGAAAPTTIFRKGHSMALTDGIYQGHYVDVPLYFKTRDVEAFDLYLQTGSDASDTSIGSGAVVGDDIYKCARVAFLSETLSENSTDGATPLVLASSEQNNSSVITSSVTPGGEPVLANYIAFQNNFSTVPVVNMEGADYNAGKTEFVTKIVLRIWVEGQDAACTVGHGGQSFNISLRFTRK